MSQTPTTTKQALIQEIAHVIQTARGLVRHAVNQAMVTSYWEIGRLIAEHEQKGDARAAYGKQQLQYLSQQLTVQFGKGFDVTNLPFLSRLPNSGDTVSRIELVTLQCVFAPWNAR